MIVTILAITFFLLIVVIAVFGFKAVIQRAPTAEQQQTEKCAICRARYDKSDLLLREIGDYKLLYFCRECVLKLYADLGLKN